MTDRICFCLSCFKKIDSDEPVFFCEDCLKTYDGLDREAQNFIARLREEGL